MHIIIDGKEEARRERCKTCGRDLNGIVRIPTGILPVKYSADGKKILKLIKIGENGVEYTERYLVEHLLDDDGNITEQTLKREDEIFKELS